MTSVAYAGTRVIEIASTLSAGVAGRFFADLGADVVRVEEIDHLTVDPAGARGADLGSGAQARSRSADAG